MWRSVIIYNGERLSVKDEWLIIDSEGEKEKKIPLDDLYCIVIDNRDMLISTYALSALAKHRVHVITTDERHLPVGQLYPLNTNYHCYRVLKKQLALSDSFKGEIWKEIVIRKIRNQAVCLDNVWSERDVIKRMLQLADEVTFDDLGNREAIAAKMHFRSVFGANFIRFADDNINAFLNYGYAVLRSDVAKSLVVHGFNCVLGVHHISEENEFNLADDFIEPVRPIVDEWVGNNMNSTAEGLTPFVKNSLINLNNTEVLFDGKVTKLRYAIDSMVKSFVTCVETNNPSRLILPEVISHHEK